MPNRRDFLKTTTLATAAGWGAEIASPVSRSFGAAHNPGAMPAVDDALKRDSLRVQGTFHQATIPDTLDLADRAKLSLNVLTHNVDPNYFYYEYQEVDFGPRNPGPDPNSRTWDLTPDNARAIPWMRTMCGSNEYLDQEYGMLKAMLDYIREDGLLYYPVPGYRPKDTTYPDTNGYLVLAIENHYALDGNRQWLDWIALLASGLKKVAIQIEDRAYYPPECTVTPDGKWLWNLRGHAMLPYDPPQEPYLEQQGLEGSVKYEQATAMRALVRAYRYNGDQDALALLRKFVQFDLKPGMWENTTLEGYRGNEHGVFGGHFHGNVLSLLSLLDVADAEGNDWLKDFVREGYNNAIRHGAVRAGWFPGWITPTKYDRDGVFLSHSETDGLAEMLELGVRLSDAGFGDYWDDVDAIMRNQLAEQQFCSLDVMREASKGASGLERFVGGFTEVPTMTAASPAIFGCCTVSGAVGLYYAWEGITRFRDGVATVNLFLNRSSKWIDVNSYLPYEGKVELHNKEAGMALVRIPNWVNLNEVKSFIDDKATQPPFSGRYLVFRDLQKGDVIRIELPNPERTDSYTIAGIRYQIRFRGSTIVDIEPRSTAQGLIPLYQRSYFKAQKAPMRRASRFVPDKILPLQ